MNLNYIILKFVFVIINLIPTIVMICCYSAIYLKMSQNRRELEINLTGKQKVVGLNMVKTMLIVFLGMSINCMFWKQGETNK